MTKKRKLTTVDEPPGAEGKEESAPLAEAPTPPSTPSRPHPLTPPQLVAQLHDCDVYEGTPEQLAALAGERMHGFLADNAQHGLSRLRAAREANGEPPPSEEELKDLREHPLSPEEIVERLARVNTKQLTAGDRCVPNFEFAVAALEKFAEELQSEIEWVAELHRHDKTGQAGADQKMLGWLRLLALRLAKDAKKVALDLNFGFGEKKG